jgi:putative hydrolase of the HAD superfamily
MNRVSPSPERAAGPARPRDASPSAVRGRARAAPRAILFDFGGTLDADGIPWKERFQRLYRAEGLDLGDDAFAARFHAADDSLIGRLGPEAGLRRTIAALVERLEPLLPAGPSGRGERVAERFLRDAEACLAHNRISLERLARRFKLGIVSNFYGNLAGVAEETGIAALFGALVDSAVVGESKPSPAIFRRALERLGVSGAEAVHVGDSLARDRAGAAAAGIAFVWVARPTEPAPAGAQADPRVARVADLPEMLAAWGEAA